MDVMELDTTEMDVLITDLEVHDGLPLSRVISDVLCFENLVIHLA